MPLSDALTRCLVAMLIASGATAATVLLWPVSHLAATIVGLGIALLGWALVTRMTDDELVP